MTIDYSNRKASSIKFSRVGSEESLRKLECGWLPCCMSPEDAESFGHHVSIFMVALVAFATFFCVTFILILVFVLG
ncbi:unnamed protein product [Caenorhabditis angaria]|uniref:Uncharacterized protein n=1 Tax=Caenorhabditis angaria TaxID=860376 RepID=A0A9P1I8W4_9PELO|nr:unnamed protein product [Caenorhabditis angaria]